MYLYNILYIQSLVAKCNIRFIDKLQTILKNSISAGRTIWQESTSEEGFDGCIEVFWNDETKQHTYKQEQTAGDGMRKVSMNPILKDQGCLDEGHSQKE